MVNDKRPSPNGELRVAPWDAMLLEVRRASYKVGWIDWMVGTLHEQEQVLEVEVRECDDPEMRTSKRHDLASTRLELKDWVKESRAERQHLLAASSAAIRAGLNQRILSQIEIEQTTITRVLMAGIEVLGLDPFQKAQALTAMRDAVRNIALERRGDGPEAEALKAIGGTDTGRVGVMPTYAYNGSLIGKVVPIDETNEDTRFSD